MAWRILLSLGMLTAGLTALADEQYTPGSFDRLVVPGESAAVRLSSVVQNEGGWEAHASFTEDSPIEPLPASPDEVFDNPAWRDEAERPAINPEFSYATRAYQRHREWYVRFDHYCWDERVDNWRAVRETGLLTTLGFARRIDRSRYRAEMFGGNMDYDGHLQGYPPIEYHQSGLVTYLGCRGEYEYIIEPENWERTRFFLGMGARFWFRNFNEGAVGSQPVASIHEIWGTFYPYVGIERKEPDEPGIHFFYSARLGLTAYTYERCSNNVTLHPKSGATIALQLGIRAERLVLSAYLETMAWEKSDAAHGYFQPESEFTTIGGRFAFRH